jgi:hypothetical protein
MTNRGSLVLWEYFKDAIARSTATALDILEEASERGEYMEENATAVKGRPFNRWIQEEDGEKLEDAIKWGWWKICLVSEEARGFWHQCLGEYKDEGGTIRKTGVSNPEADNFDSDKRVRYVIRIPDLFFDGLTPGGDDATNSARLMRAINGMSKGNLKPGGCDTGIVRQTAANGVPWVHMTVRASISWDRAAQELGYQVKGVLGDIVLKRLKKARAGPEAAGDVNMETEDAGCPRTPTTGTIEPLPPVDDSPEM